MNFKQWFFNELEIATLGKEKIYPSGSSSVITLGQKRSSEVSGFCLHNPEINAFAQKNSTNMFRVFAFVFYTVRKDWPTVYKTFPDFLKWVFEEAIYKTKKGKPNAWDYKDEPFRSLSNTLSHGDENKATYLEELWAKKDTIYTEIKGFIDKYESTSFLSDSSDFKIFQYIVKNIKGLAAVKGAFATQLIIGKYGCVDSVNMRAYDKMIRDDIKKDPKKSGFSLANSGKKDALGNPIKNIEVKSSDVGLKGYVRFLDTLQELYGDSISKMLWDDWCEIVHNKITMSNDKGENKKITLKVNNQEIKITPYKDKIFQKPELAHMNNINKDAAEELEKHIPGIKVSHQHLKSLEDGWRYTLEKFDITKVLKKIKILKEYILSQNIL